MNIREELGVLHGLCALVNDAHEVRVTSIMVHAPATPRDAGISVTLQFVATALQLHGALAVTSHRDVTITSRSINKMVIAFPGLAFGATLENISGEACNTLSGAVAECDSGKSHTVCMAILTAALKTMRTLDLANGFSRQSPAIVNEVMLRIGDMLTAFPATSPHGGQMDKHVVAESVHRLHDAVKNTRDARLGDFTTSQSGLSEVGYVYASFMEPGNPNGKHTLTFVLGKNDYELRFDDAALLSAAIQPLQRTPVHIFGAATVDCRQNGVLICLAALSVIRDLLAKPSTHSAQAALLSTHVGSALRALRDEHTKTSFTTEVAREIDAGRPHASDPLGDPSSWSTLQRKTEEMRAEAERNDLPVFGPVQDSNYLLSAPTFTADFDVHGGKFKCTTMRTNLTPADNYGSKPRYNNRMRKRDSVAAVIGGSTYDWFRVNMGPNSETRIAQLVDIAELTLTFEFRDSLDGKRTTSKINFSGFAQMKENLQRIVGDPFRTDNSVFTKRLGVDLPYDID